MLHNDPALRSCGIRIPSARRCPLKVRKNINCERYESRPTGSVAKQAGGLGLVQPRTKEEQRTNVEVTTVRHNFAKPLLCARAMIVTK